MKIQAAKIYSGWSKGREELCNHCIYVDVTIKFMSTFMEENMGKRGQ